MTDANTINVVSFPNRFENRQFPQTEDLSHSHIFNVRREYCDEIAEDCLESIRSVLIAYGIDVYGPAPEDCEKDQIFLTETLSAVIYRRKRIEHPFQSLIDKTIQIKKPKRDNFKEEINISTDK
jgi:cobalamin biosynthesis Mg chelatase CobN